MSSYRVFYFFFSFGVAQGQNIFSVFTLIWGILQKLKNNGNSSKANETGIKVCFFKVQQGYNPRHVFIFVCIAVEDFPCFYCETIIRGTRSYSKVSNGTMLGQHKNPKEMFLALNKTKSQTHLLCCFRYHYFHGLTMPLSSLSLAYTVIYIYIQSHYKKKYFLRFKHCNGQNSLAFTVLRL